MLFILPSLGLYVCKKKKFNTNKLDHSIHSVAICLL
jgi:hypothetical protein